MKTVPLSTIFDVTYGNKLDFNKMRVTTAADETRVSFVGRGMKNNGFVAYVKEIREEAPYPVGVITVALGGTKLLTSHLQVNRFYTAQNVAVLVPKVSMSTAVLLFYCTAVEHNRYKYSAFGREANRTLRMLQVPSLEETSRWVGLIKIPDIEKYTEAISPHEISTKVLVTKKFKYDYLFDIKKGKRLTKQNMIEGDTPFVGSSDSNNGITALINADPMHPGNVITVAYDGSVGEAFYQPEPFWALDSVNVLYPKFKMNIYTALYLCTLIRLEKYRYSYGRKWTMGRMNESEIELPIDGRGDPDWIFMAEYIKSLPYSKVLETR